MPDSSLSRFDREIVAIRPGEYYATLDDKVISTVLGSCVSVALFDEDAKAGGLNHFMLPRTAGAASGTAENADARFGLHAMDLLIRSLVGLGARKSALRAKVFGGGAVLRIAGVGARIPKENIDFAYEYLREEGIPIVAADVGGDAPRKILFFTRTGKALVKRIPGPLVIFVEAEEKRYLHRLKVE